MGRKGPADHREEIRRLVADARDEPTYCEFKRELAYETKKQKAELVKDVSSFANIDLAALGGYGYLIFGVSDKGDVAGIGEHQGDPPSELRKVVNGHLGRPVAFEYLTCEVDDGAGGTKRVAAVVVPDSRRRPHVASREIKERLSNKDKFWLREGEVWVRKTGSRELATAEELDAMYEGKLRELVENAVRPIEDAVARLERDVAEMRGATPDLVFGFTASNTDEPLEKGSPVAVVGTAISLGSWEETRQLLHIAQTRAAASHPNNVGFGPEYPPLRGDLSSEKYRKYAENLRWWTAEIQGLLIFEFMLSNTGQSVAQDVEVVLKVPATLVPTEELPERPELPTSSIFGGFEVPPMGGSGMKEKFPDELFGPYVELIDASRSDTGTLSVRWEVGKLYHGRPLFTRSDEDDVEGLVVLAEGYRLALEQAGGEVRLPYTIHAANLRDPVRGSLFLK